MPILPKRPSKISSAKASKSKLGWFNNPAKYYQRHKKRVIRTGIITGNLLVIIVALIIVLAGSGGNAANYSSLSSAEEVKASNPLDTVSATDIAVNVALMTRLPEAGLIINEADSVNAALSAGVSSHETVLKPQILSSDIKTKQDIISYTVTDGDTLASLAERFGVTSDSIRWSNNLRTSTLQVGSSLAIPPINGIVYTVKSGDSAESLGAKYNVNKDLITRFNDAEIKGLIEGERIVIPGGVIKAAPVVARAPYYAGFAFGNTAIYGYNGYVPGYCTWYVANKRIQAGRPLPANLGNAGPWISHGTAARAGFAVNHIPAVGAAVVTSTRNPGHVAYVEEVRSDGSVLVSEMNRRRLYEVTTRVFSPGEASRYWYIH